MILSRFTVLYVLSINVLIISRVIPYGGLLGLFLILFSVFFYAKGGVIKSYLPIHSNWFKVIIFFFILQFTIYSIGFNQGLSSSLHQYIIYSLLVVCFFLILIASNKKELDYYLKYYIKFSFLMALFGFLAWAIIFFDIVDKASNIWDARNFP